MNDDLQKRAEEFVEGIEADYSNAGQSVSPECRQALGEGYIAGATSQDAISRKDERMRIVQAVKAYAYKNLHAEVIDGFLSDAFLVFLKQLETGETK